MNDEGVLTHGHAKVAEVAVEFYQKLLGTESMVGPCNLAHITFDNRLTAQVGSLLDRPITEDEIISTLRAMKPNKSPGPDGFNTNFFIHTWDIVGSDFVAAVKSFFHQGCLLRGVNATAITLVPKVSNPTSMNDFRPISCCNILYKCISKILAARLKLVLPQIISPSQAAFVPGRSIGDNILLAQELFRNYHRKAGPARCALKIDLQKAFDSVNWRFLIEALYKFGFPPKFIFWVSSCITTPLFSVKVNGSLCGFFRGKKGLRQGDPLSPYLFVIAMEVLSLLINSASKQQGFSFHWRTKQLNITHLMFADDLLMFCKGDLSSALILKNCLDHFSIISGLQVNTAKSTCYLSNVSDHLQQDMLQVLGFQLGSLPAKFLGVPLITSKLTASDCQPLVDRIVARITSWTNRSLSYAGRLLLINSILFAIQSYWTAHFLLPAAAFKEIQSIFCRFLWKGPSLGKFGAKVSWDNLCLPFAEGGLQLKHLKDWNRAQLLLKICSIINPSSHSLWARWVKSTIIKDRNFWIIPVPSDCSWIWRKVLQLRHIAAQHVNFIVGNGAGISLWFDPWTDHSPLASSIHDPLVQQSGLGANASVQQIISNQTWNLPCSNHSSVMDFRNQFDFSRTCNPAAPDQILWEDSRIEVVKARAIWETIRRRRNTIVWSGLVWHKGIPPRLSFVLWLAFCNSLRTKDRLASYGLVLDTTCVLCQQHMETADHLFFQCCFSFQIMFYVLRQCGWQGSSRDWGQITSYLLNKVKGQLRKVIIYLGFAAVVYYIWKERNSRIHIANHRVPARTIANQIMLDIKCRLASIVKFQKVRHLTWFTKFAM